MEIIEHLLYPPPDLNKIPTFQHFHLLLTFAIDLPLILFLFFSVLFFSGKGTVRAVKHAEEHDESFVGGSFGVIQVITLIF